MPINIQDYLLGRIPVGRKIDIPAYLMAKAASGGGIHEITGTLPLYVRSRASQVLKNYIIYGTASGAGVETENLWDFSVSTKGLLKADGSLENNPYYTTSDYIPVTAEQSYTFRALSGYELGRYVRVAWYDSDRQIVGYLDVTRVAPVGSVYAKSYTAPNNASYSRVCGFSRFDSEFMFVEGSTAPSSYIPHGYKLPITVTSNGTTTDYPVYIGDSQLGEEEYVDYESGKVYKRTANLWDFTTQPLSGAGYLYNGSINLPAGTYTLRADVISGSGNMSFAVVDTQGNTVINTNINNYRSKTFTSDYDMTQLRFYVNGTVDELYLTLVSGSTAPESHIPYLQPTDPPVPLPDITIPKGEVTVDTEDELKPQATIKGKIKQI